MAQDSLDHVAMPYVDFNMMLSLTRAGDEKLTNAMLDKIKKVIEYVRSCLISISLT